MVGVSPCKECTERYMACHDSCERYGEWKNKLEIHNAARRSTWQEKVKYSHTQMKRIKGQR